MWVYVLLVLISIQVVQLLRKRIPSLQEVVGYLIPYWIEGDAVSHIIGIIQMGLILFMSCLKAYQAVDKEGAVVVFILTFMSMVGLIKMLSQIMEWVQEYIYKMTANILFTVFVPLTILLSMSDLYGILEVRVSLVALGMSLVIVYVELISLVVGYKEPEKKKALASKGLKIKSILTWFMIILLNLYTLILFIQFYVEESMPHFIPATKLNKEAAIDLFYYLVVTFTTVGFGDIRPNTLLAKLVTTLVALSGMLFTGIFVGSILTSEE